MTAECRLCPGRVCIVQGTGRLVNDTDAQHPFDLEKIHFDPTPIEECDIRPSLDTDDERLLLGS